MYNRISINLPKTIEKDKIKVLSSSVLKSEFVNQVIVDPVLRKSLVVMSFRGIDTKLVKKNTLKIVNNYFENEEKKASLKNKNSTRDNEVNKFFYKLDLADLVSESKPTNTENIANELLKNSWVFYMKGGDIGYSESISKLLRIFEDSYTHYIIKHTHQPIEVKFSPFLHIDYIKKMNLLEGDPTGYFVASSVNKQSNGNLSSMKKYAPVSEEYSNSDPQSVLQTAPCFKIYCSLENQVLSSNKMFTVTGPCFRNETKSKYFMERLSYFTMREFVFIGTPQYVIESRDLMMKLTTKWLKNMGIAGFCQEASDPFFISPEAIAKYNIPTYVKQEVRARIPYKKDSLAIASFDTHGNFFSKTFNFSIDQNPTWSGCIGLGVERTVWSFLQQFGINIQEWPKSIREKFDEQK